MGWPPLVLAGARVRWSLTFQDASPGVVSLHVFYVEVNKNIHPSSLRITLLVKLCLPLLVCKVVDGF